MSTDDMYDRVVRAISVTSLNREEVTLRLILPWFRKKSELMTSLGDDILLDILKNCEFRRYQPNSVIIQQGEVGHSFFIMLKGTTRVYVHSGEDPRPTGSNRGESPRETGATDNEDYHHKFGTMVRTLGAGKSFGELALIHKNSIRKASVIAAESSDLIVINRELYTRCLKAAQERDLNERMSFVDNHFFFKKWNQRMKTTLAMSFRRTQYRFDSVLYKRGDVIKALMLVFKGQVLVSLPVRDIIPGRRHQTKTTAYKMVDLCYVGPGGFLGDYEILTGSSTYSLMAKSFSDCEIFEIDLKSYTKIFTRRNQEALSKMKFFAEQKLVAHCSRLHQTEQQCLDPFLQRLRDERLRSQGQGHIIGEAIPLNLWNTAWGPLIDQSGPGSLYYQLKEEERRRKLREKRNAEILRRRRSSTKKPEKRQETVTFDKPQETQPEVTVLEARVQSFLSSSRGILPNDNTSITSLPLINANSYTTRKTWTSHTMRELTPSFPRRRLVTSAPLSDGRETASTRRQHTLPRFQVTAEEYKQQKQTLRREERRFYLSKLYV